MVANGEPFSAVDGVAPDASGAAGALGVAGVVFTSVLTSVVRTSVMDQFLKAARVLLRRADS
jgi:hypothetical protein